MPRANVSVWPVADQQRLFHVQKRGDIELSAPAGLEQHAGGLRRATLIGRHVGSVHTGFALVELAPSGWVDTHVHSTEQSFYVLSGNPVLLVEGRAYRLAP